MKTDKDKATDFIYGDLLGNKKGLEVKIVGNSVFYGLEDIRKAVNAHDDLVEALEEAKHILYWKSTAEEENNALDIIEKALQLARGE